MHPFDAAGLTTAAPQKEGLRDWGPLPFETPLRVLADDYAADLHDIGGHSCGWVWCTACACGSPTNCAAPEHR